MYHKKCPNCNKKSHSSSKNSKWICPYCDENLTDVETVKIGGGSDAL
jgi:ribosomal protein L37AE/L43A